MVRGEGIKPLGSLFEKYKKQLVAPQGSVKKCFSEVVLELYGYEIPTEKIDYSVSKRMLVLKLQGPLKSEILLHKREILTHLTGRLGEKNAPKTII